MRAFDFHILADDDVIAARRSVLIRIVTFQRVVIAEHGAVWRFRARADADDHAVGGFRSVIVKVRTRRFFVTGYGVVMHRTVVHFGAQCFQLRHVDRVGIGGAGRNACNLSCSSRFFIAYGKSRHLSLPRADEIAYFFLRCIIGCHLRISVRVQPIIFRIPLLMFRIICILLRVNFMQQVFRFFHRRLPFGTCGFQFRSVCSYIRIGRDIRIRHYSLQ